MTGLYRIDAIPTAERLQADDVFLVAAKEEGRGSVRYVMWLRVRSSGWTSYNKKKVADPVSFCGGSWLKETIQDVLGASETG